ncbi:hypothetical protein K461DRAFT_56610 [Myriangium duriaei CBS 260.36]|uniref:DUF3533 domain-containing protein n=1 Tax=Myriangium duriaei CBS 260.36 TaxID=1168546 RepID=A0A9P4MIR3_9PEZI|nr:hypothetical protein K461DRAFT_56610 [Myriangium duriaei CBS 260.36]
MTSENEDRQQDSHSDEEKDSGPPPPVHFFHSSLNAVRLEVLTKWAITTAVLMAFILAVLSIYWGSLVRAEKNLNSLLIAVVDFDGLTAPYNTSGIAPVFGPAIMNMARSQVASGKPTLGWIPSFASDFNYDPIQVRQAVYDQKYWGAIIINANATAEATNAVSTGNAMYDPTGAAQLVYIEARDQTVWDSFIYPTLSEFLINAQAEVSAQWAKQVLTQATTNTTIRDNIARAPSAVSPALGFALFNLRPFYPYQITPSVTVGLIYLIIISFFSFSFYLPVYTKLIKPQGHPPLKFWQMVFVRYIGIQGAYLMLSLAYSLVSLAFQIDFSTPNPVQSDTEVTLTIDGYTNAPKYGMATFVVFWTLNYVGMIALGLACENVAMLVGMPWVGLWLIFWVITNVSTSFYAIEIEPHFFYWGYAWPLHNVVEGTRTLLFDLHNRLGLNFGVLLAWAAVNTALFPISCRFMKYKNTHHIKEYWS